MLCLQMSGLIYEEVRGCTKQEAREYDIHAKSIRKIIESIGRCEKATITSSVS